MLVDWLLVLISYKYAGDIGHDNEIISVLKESVKADIIDEIDVIKIESN